MRNLRKMASLLLAMVMTLGLCAPAFAAEPVDITQEISVKSVVDSSRVTLPDAWVFGKNYIDITDGSVCMVVTRHLNQPWTEAACVERDGVYRFSVSLVPGDTVAILPLGDVNLNGETNSEDLALLARYTFNEYDFTMRPDGLQSLAADINRNGEANSEDLALLARYTFNEYEMTWNLSDNSGEITPPDPVDPEPENTAPVVELELSMLDGSQAGGYVGDTARQLCADVFGSDVEDGEDVRLFLKLDDGVWFEAKAGQNILGYAQSGEHVVYAKARDSHGLESEIVEKTITIEQVSTLPVLVAEFAESTMGREFHVSVKVNDNAADSSVFEVWSTTWTLTNAATGDIMLQGFTEPAEIEVENGSIVIGNVSKYGLDIAMTGATGEYELTAVSTDQYGNQVWSGSVILTVTNAAPGEAVSGLSYSVDRTDVSMPYTDKAQAKVSFTFDDAGVDPDGDAVVLYNAATNQPLTDGYYPVGETALTLYPVDAWGLAGEAFEYSVIIDNQAPDVPVITIDKQTDNTKWTNGEWTMYVGTDVSASDFDGDAVALEYESEMPSGYYATGSYLIRVRAVDIFGAVSDWTERAVDLNNAPIDPPDGGSVDVDTSFTLTANGQKEITVHAGPAVLMQVTAGEYEIHETAYRQFLNGNMDIAQETVKFSEADLADGRGMSLSWTPQAAGDYVYEVSAMANDKDIVTSELTRLTDTVIIHVTNEAPEAPVISAQVDYSNVSVLSDGTMQYYVELTGSAVDADGDRVTVIWDKSNRVSGYYAPGTYAVTGVYAEDEFGGRSPENELYRFTVAADGSPVVAPEPIRVHQGDEFCVTVYGGKFDVQELQFDYAGESLVKTGNPALFAGGTYLQGLSISSAPGEYSVQVTARVRTENGMSEMAAGVVPVTVYNTAPVVTPGTAVTQDYTDGKMCVSLDYAGRDDDGDDIDVFYSVNGGVSQRLDFATGTLELAVPFGDYMLEFWAVDQWGLESEHVTREFHTGSYFTDNFRQPDVSFTVTDKFQNAYTVDAKVQVEFQVNWNEALDMSQVDRIEYRVNGQTVDSLTGYYSLGKYEIDVYGIDALGVESAHGTAVLNLNNTAPVVRYARAASDRTDYVNEYTDDAAYKFIFTTATSDAETPNSLKLMMSADGKVFEASGESVTDISGQTVEGDGTAYYGIGRHSVEVYAVDVWGAESNSATITVDAVNTAPVIESAGFDPVTEDSIKNPYTPDASIILTGSVSGSDADNDAYKFEYTVDGKAVDSLDGEYAPGVHTVTVLMRDVFNGVAEKSFETDLSSQNISIEVSHEMLAEWTDEFTENARQRADIHIKLAGVDENSQYKLYMSVDGGEYTELERSAEQTVAGSFGLGEHEISVYAVDMLGIRTEAVTDKFELKSDVPESEVAVQMMDDFTDIFTSNAKQKAEIAAVAVNDTDESVRLIVTTPTDEHIFDTDGVKFIDSFGLGSNTVQVTAIDVWGQRADVFKVIVLESEMPDVSVRVRDEDEYNARAFTSACQQRGTVIVDIENDVGERAQATVKVGNSAAKTYTPGNPYNYVQHRDWFKLGDTDIVVSVTDIWGQTKTVTLVKTTENTAPVLGQLLIAADMTDLTNAYTSECTVGVDISVGSVTDEKMTGRYVPKLVCLVDGDRVDSLDAVSVIRGTHTVEVYAVDVWGIESQHVKKTVTVDAQAPVLALTSSTFADPEKPFTGSALVEFDMDVTGVIPYQLKWLDYYTTSKTVTTIRDNDSSNLTAQHHALSKQWTVGKHLLVVQAKNIFGDAVYASYYFMAGTPDGAGGSVSLNGVYAEVQTDALTFNGTPLAYVKDFNVSVPLIPNHSNDDGDTLTVIGVDAAGNETQLVQARTRRGPVTITARNGRGTYEGDSFASGSFTYDPNKYVFLKLQYQTLPSHAGCMQTGGQSMSYSLAYGFIRSDSSLSGLDDLFNR